MAAECLLTERLGLFAIAILTLSTFSVVRTVEILPRGFLFKAAAFSRKFCTHSFYGVTTGNTAVAYPGIFFGGGVQQIQLRTKDRENGDLGMVAP